jgi:hypothetical protein
MWFPRVSVFLWACLRVLAFFLFFLFPSFLLPSFFLSLFLFFFVSFFLYFFLSFFFLSFFLSLSVSVCSAKEVDKGRVPGLAKKVVFAASTPTAFSAVGVTGKVGVVE